MNNDPPIMLRAPVTFHRVKLDWANPEVFRKVQARLSDDFGNNHC